MEKPIRRKCVKPNIFDGLETEVGKISQYESFKLQTRGEYEDLMMEFEFRCKRAAMMHYYEASRYDSKIYMVEIVSAVIGGVSVTSVGSWFLHRHTASLGVTSMPSVGPMGALGLGLVFLIQLVCKGCSRILPSFSDGKQEHVTCAAAWQRLAMKTRSYRIQLDNPKIDVDTYAAWFLDVITEREALCAKVCVPQSTYQLYCDPMRVFVPMKQRRLMYVKFLQLEDMGVDDVDDIKDFKIGKEL